MSGQIVESNNQVEQLQSITVPTGINLLLNISPSLPATTPGQLARDPVVPGSLLVSDGSQWNYASYGAGYMFAASASVTGVTFTSTSNPAFTPVNCYFESHTIGTNASNVSMVSFCLTSAASGVTVTAANNYSCPAGTIPANFRPGSNVSPVVLPCVVNLNGTNTVLTVSIFNDGSITIKNTASSGTWAFTEISGVYHILL